MTRYAEYLAGNYGTNADVTWMLDTQEIHLVLHTNPDGRKQAETGLLWRKNTNPVNCGNNNNRGIDLNRNFPYNWACCGGSSGQGCAETYRGPTPGSEPETQAVRDYMQAIFPDYGDPGSGNPVPPDSAGLFIDIHSYGQLLLWPWGGTTTVAPNGIALQTLGRKFAYFNNHLPEQSIYLYATDGTTIDNIYGQLGVSAFTFEIGNNFFQDCATFTNSILPTNMRPPTSVICCRTSRAAFSTARPEM